MRGRLAEQFMLFLVCCLLISHSCGQSSLSAGQNQNLTALPSTEVFPVTTENLDNLQQTLTQPATAALDIAVTRAELQARPAAWQSTESWVRSGGVAFMHTDAAQLFGYRTVAARIGTPQLAGQLYGKAEAVFPSEAHALLNSEWNNEKMVRAVYYHMAPGDHLVVNHPAGVALLRVVDFVAPSTTPLYAAALAPYGKGWVVFTPRVVEGHRADGAAFLRNLMRFVQACAKPSRSLDTAVIGLPIQLLPDNPASQAAANNQSRTDMVTLGEFLRSSLQPVSPTEQPTQVRLDEARLLLTRGELRAAWSLWQRAAATTNVTEPELQAASVRLQTLLKVWRARWALQNNDFKQVLMWLSGAEREVSGAAETLLWRGVLVAAQAQDITLSSGDKAAALEQAAGYWQQASKATALTATALPVVATAENTTAPREETIGSVSRTTLDTWRRNGLSAARKARAEPPLVTVQGKQGQLIVLQCVAVDEGVRTTGVPDWARHWLAGRIGSDVFGPFNRKFQAVSAERTLAPVLATLGWKLENEEILIFDNYQQYANYRIAAGITRQKMPLPQGSVDEEFMQRRLITQRDFPLGDIDDGRLLMTRLVRVRDQNGSVFILPPTATSEGYKITIKAGTTTPAVLGRMHAYAMINAIAEGGTPVPEWMHLGLAGISIVSVVQQSGFPEITVPSQDKKEIQAMQMMQTFYTRFGKGAVVETLQRLGAGESVDAALLATTGFTQQQLLQNLQAA
jgi:hypothetical protein